MFDPKKLCKWCCNGWRTHGEVVEVVEGNKLEETIKRVDGLRAKCDGRGVITVNR